MSATPSPAKVLSDFTESLHAGRLDAVADLYEADALLVPTRGPAVRGRAAIREAYERLWAARPQLDLHVHEAHWLDDLAVFSNDWTMHATGPDGTPVKEVGRSVVVLRRGPDGTWRIAIDRP